MEKELKIPIPGTKLNIYAKQYGSLENPVVIFVHGLTGHMDEHLFYNGARYFHQHGLSSIRFNLYDYEKDARKLMDCTLKTHAHDFNVVSNYLHKKKVSKIFAIGHSYGGPSILLADHAKVQGIVLWDPTASDLFDQDEYVPELNAYRLRWGIDVLTGFDMREEAKALVWDNLTANISTPIKIIAAGNGAMSRGDKNYYKQYLDRAKGLAELTVIKNADHNFTKDGTAEKLFAESVNWLKQF